MRLATLDAAMRRGWVWPISLPLLALPRPSESAILGNCVVLPEPVSPQTMMTWCRASARAISSRRPETGKDSGNEIAGNAALKGVFTRRELSVTTPRRHDPQPRNDAAQFGHLSFALPMSLVFPHTFVPWFRSVAPYIHAYRGKTFVVAMAGE